MQIFCNVSIRAAPLIVNNCTCVLDSNAHAILFLNDNNSANVMSIKTVSHGKWQWSVRRMFCSCPCCWIRGSAIITPSSRFWWEYCHSLIWAETKHVLLTLTTPRTTDSHRLLKTFKSAFMLLLIQKEQHSLFNHTSLFLSYRHLNNRSTGIKVFSLGINTYCLK